ncbi:hypothetical protein [Klebsiella pneumoniae]|uniref:hypothetical protein n=1 Tax=Klebsiella pneumoniae TaxID=573 RepID=UPI003F57F398
MAELNPPLGTTTPEIFLDNVKRADELVNGPAGTVNDRGGEPLDTWRQMMAKNDEIRQNLIPLSKQYATLAAAQADIANIPEGSATYVRSQDGSSLADEYINNNGNLEPTGRKMGAKGIDITSATPAATWIHNCVIFGNSTNDYVSVINNSSVTGVSVLISANPGETVYIGNKVSASRFRILDLPSYPIDGMKRPGQRYSYDGTGSAPDDVVMNYGGVAFLIKKYTVADDARFILVYQSSSDEEQPIIFSTSAETGYRYLSTHAEYNIENNLNFTDTTYERIVDAVRVDFGAAKLYGSRKTGRVLPYLGIGTDTPAYMTTSAQYGPNLYSIANRVQPGTRYTFIAAWDGNVAPTRFRLALIKDYPARRSILNRVVAVDGSRTVVIERDGRTYGYVTFDTNEDDNWLVSTLTNTGQEIDFAILEGDFVKGESYKALTKRVDFGEVVSTPVLEAGNIISPMFSMGKNLFDGVYVYGYSPTYSEVTSSDDYNVHLTPTYNQADPNYKTLVSVVVPCKPNTKYAISRSGGTRFYVGLSKFIPSTYVDSGEYAGLMRTVVNDNSLDSYVITTNENDRFIYVYLSNSGGGSWCQVEENDHVTTYETYGWKFTQAAELVSSAQGGRDTGYISVGVGDGLTPDSDNLQAVINLISGEINFDPTKKYLLDKTLTIDASFAKGLFGNRATFIVAGDFPAFTVNGGMVSGDSSPGSTGSTARRIGGFRIDSLRAYSSDGVSGVGLAVSGMLHPRITNCDLMYLKTGMKFSKRSRNVIISDNHIYACSDYGIHYDNTCDIHQMNIIGNAVTYCKRNIFLDNAAIYNLQITGNDIETGEYLTGDSSARANIWITAQTSNVEDIVICGNTLEDHWTSDHLVRIDGATINSALSIAIAGNSTGNSKKDDIAIGGASGVEITGQFKQSWGKVVRAIGPINGMKLSVQGQRVNSNSGGLFISEGAWDHTYININGCQISGGGSSEAVVVTGANLLRNFVVSNNALRDKGATSIRLEASTMNGVRVDSNAIDNGDASSVTNAIVVAATTVIGKNSMMLNSATKGGYTAPAGFNVQGNF